MENQIELNKKRSKKNILGNILMIVSIVGLLGLIFNWYYGIGYILILLIHESGHYVASKFLKVNVRFGNITPFGAYIIHGNINNCKDEAIISLAGPVFGSIGAFVYFIIYYFTKDNTFYILSFISVVINLTNLVPIKPLDGGYVVTAISYKICYLGFPFLIYFLISVKSIKSKIFTFMTLITAIYQTHDLRKKYYKESYFNVDKNIKIKFIIVYISILLILGVSAMCFYKYSDFKQLFNSIARFNSK